MPLHPAATPCLLLTALALALSACGEREQGFEPVVVEQEADPLPAPLPATGPVTGPGPGAPPPAGGLVGDVPEPGATAPIGLSVVAPVDGTGTLHIVDADADPAAASAPVASIAFSDGPLPPLEDHPESGLAAAATDPAATERPGAEQAAAAVRAYYDAVASGDRARAYAAWSDGGRASGRTSERFATGFYGVAITSVAVGVPGPSQGAAGSRYVEVPVTVTSRGRDGRETRQAGTFVMRSSAVDGAPAGWFIASADLRELQP